MRFFRTSARNRVTFEVHAFEMTQTLISNAISLPGVRAARRGGGYTGSPMSGIGVDDNQGVWRQP